MSDSSHLLPPFLRLNSKITHEHKGQYRKGFLTQVKDGTYYFSYKSHTNKKQLDWSVPILNLISTRHNLWVKGILLPGHSSTPFVQDLLANFVSAAILVRKCPHSLLTALANLHPDQDVWLCSFREEKYGIKLMDTYNTINVAQYRALWEKGAPRAIPTMRVLAIKPDKKPNLHQAKAQIIVLGNHKDCLWYK
jgi:hypothetical protein